MFAINCPIKKNPNHRRWTSMVKMGVCIKTGPGHNPPIPQPIPKHIPPPISLTSITLFTGLNSFSPKSGSFLTFIMYVKVTILTANPAPRTNISDGFQSLVNAKKLIMLVLLTIPDTKSPHPKTNPTKNTISWSLTKKELELNL